MTGGSSRSGPGPSAWSRTATTAPACCAPGAVATTSSIAARRFRSSERLFRRLELGHNVIHAPPPLAARPARRRLLARTRTEGLVGRRRAPHLRRRPAGGLAHLPQLAPRERGPLRAAPRRAPAPPLL